MASRYMVKQTYVSFCFTYDTSENKLYNTAHFSLLKFLL
jgi:hypothetical protein